MLSQMPMVTPSLNLSGQPSLMPRKMPNESHVFDNILGEGCNMNLNESLFPWFIDFDWMNITVFLLTFGTSFGYMFPISLVMEKDLFFLSNKKLTVGYIYYTSNTDFM